MKMTLHRRGLSRVLSTVFTVLGALALLSSLAAQESLRQSAESAGTDWIIGQWAVVGKNAI